VGRHQGAHPARIQEARARQVDDQALAALLAGRGRQPDAQTGDGRQVDLAVHRHHRHTGVRETILESDIPCH
jgi:hypothetical protein